VYAGAGDLITGLGINEGNGVYKSTDAGKTWQHMGLDESKQIPSMLVDPRDANVVLVAAQGDVHKKSESRGVFRSTDGGRNWTRTLHVDDETGIQKLARTFDVPNVIFATTARHYVSPVPRPRPAGPVLGVGLAGAVFTSVMARLGAASGALFVAARTSFVAGAIVAGVGAAISLTRGTPAEIEAPASLG
jgi:hypothetical protein